jgi:GcrA cell cycle regulator
LRQRVLELSRHGMDYEAISERLGCPIHYVRQTCSGARRMKVKRVCIAWTDEMIATLETEWKAGLTATEIGRTLGLSRCAVLGKVHRLGLMGRTATTRGRSVVQPKKKRNPAARPAMARDAEMPRLRPLPAAEPYIELPTNEIPTRTILTIERGECRYPIGDPRTASFGLCGHEAIPGQPYCLGHAKRCFTIPEVANKGLEVAAKFIGAKTGVVIEKEDA